MLLPQRGGTGAPLSFRLRRCFYVSQIWFQSKPLAIVGACARIDACTIGSSVVCVTTAVG
jgi:hypothetical protein